MNTKFLFNTLKYLAGAIFFVIELYAESASDTFLSDDLYHAANPDHHSNADENIYFYYAMMAGTALAAVPLVLTMLESWLTPQEQNMSHNDELNPLLTNPSPPSSQIRHCSRWFIHGLPFGLLACGGSMALLNEIKFSSSCIRWIISSLAGLNASLANYMLHSTPSSSKHIAVLFKALPNKSQKIKAIYFMSSVLLGNICLGFIDSEIFIRAFGIKNPWFHYGPTITLGLIVAMVEGQSNLHDVLQHLLENPINKPLSYSSRLIAMGSALIHSMQPTLGAVTILEIFYTLHTDEELYASMSFITRLTMLVGIALFMAYPNAKEFYYLTANGTDAALKRSAQALCHPACPGLFRAPRNAIPNMNQNQTDAEETPALRA